MLEILVSPVDVSKRGAFLKAEIFSLKKVVIVDLQTVIFVVIWFKLAENLKLEAACFMVNTTLSEARLAKVENGDEGRQMANLFF